MRRSLCIQTVHFDKSDVAAARQLGTQLYQLLTRPLDDPLSCGSGIPVLSGVRSNLVQPGVAESVLLVPVLGNIAFNTRRAKIIQQLRQWSEELSPNQLLLLPASEIWQNAAAELPVPLASPVDFSDPVQLQSATEQILLSAIQLLNPKGGRPGLFVSYSAESTSADDDMTERLVDYLKQNVGGDSFFDQVQILDGASLTDKMDDTARGVFVVIRSDSYGSRNWSQRELLAAKRLGLPTLTIEVLKEGERRSSPYAGNTQTFVWNGDPGSILMHSMVRWLQTEHFLVEGKRLIETASLPSDTLILPRAPELLDLAQGPLLQNQPQLVLHPEPELPVSERQILQLAHPRLRLVTPTTIYRRLLAPREGPVVDALLEHMNVAMSLSQSPDAGGNQGFTDEHIKDATIFLARALVSAGATIAYGGDFRRDPNNYTTLLGEIVARYHNTTADYKEFLHSYIAAPIDLELAPPSIPLTIHRIHDEDDGSEFESILPSGEFDGSHPAALYFSDMRWVMAGRTSARIIMAGQNSPRTADGGAGYGGLYSGVAEEAWRTLESNKPLYVIGGFGGAAADIADIFEGKPTPDSMNDEKWLAHEFFKANVESIHGDPFFEKLGLPRTMAGLADAIRSFAEPLMESDDSCLAWNGLTRDQNLELFRTTDPLTMTALVYQGLSNVSRTTMGDKLLVELTPGNVTAGRDLDAISVAIIDNMPLGGAAAAIDQIISGRARIERSSGNSLISLADASLGADWLHLASLGPLGTVDEVLGRIKNAAENTASMAARHGLQRIGVVSYGGAIVNDVEKVASAMIDGFQSLAGGTTIVWFESNDQKLEALKQVFSSRAEVQLSVRPASLIPEAASAVVPQNQLIMQVTSDGQALNITVLPPAGTGIAFSNRVELDETEWSGLIQGGGTGYRNSPAIEDLQQRGSRIAEILLQDHAAELIHRCRGSKFVVVHDIASSWIPFEMLAADPSEPPSTGSGMCRRLAIDWAPVETLFAKPARAGKLNVLLVVNPTLDLPGSAKEGQEIRDILQLNDRIQLTVLEGEKATCENVIRALPEADVLHYAGHAFFDGPAEHESGLILHGPKKLTIRELQDVQMPQIAIVNACEAGRVRSLILEEEAPVTVAGQASVAERATPGTDAASLAGLFLRSGIEAYVGTFWRVSDEGASQFANQIYTQLASGQKLDSAVASARRKLFESGHPDWANYILYGEGNFQLVKVENSA